MEFKRLNELKEELESKSVQNRTLKEKELLNELKKSLMQLTNESLGLSKDVCNKCGRPL